MSSRADVLAKIQAFQPVDRDWRPLAHLLDQLCRNPLDAMDVATLMSVFERFPTDDGAGTFWSIVHGLESSPDCSSALPASLRRRPSEFGVIMVNRALNAGESELGGVPAIQLLREVSGRPTLSTKKRIIC